MNRTTRLPWVIVAAAPALCAAQDHGPEQEFLLKNKEAVEKQARRWLSARSRRILFPGRIDKKHGVTIYELNRKAAEKVFFKRFSKNVSKQKRSWLKSLNRKDPSWAYSSDKTLVVAHDKVARVVVHRDCATVHYSAQAVTVHRTYSTRSSRPFHAKLVWAKDGSSWRIGMRPDFGTSPVQPAVVAGKALRKLPGSEGTVSLAHVFEQMRKSKGRSHKQTMAVLSKKRVLDVVEVPPQKQDRKAKKGELVLNFGLGHVLVRPDDAGLKPEQRKLLETAKGGQLFVIRGRITSGLAPFARFTFERGEKPTETALEPREY